MKSRAVATLLCAVALAAPSVAEARVMSGDDSIAAVFCREAQDRADVAWEAGNKRWADAGRPMTVPSRYFYTEEEWAAFAGAIHD